MKGIRRHLSYANVAATLALVVAVGGGTTAIALKGKGTVRSDDIRNGHVTGNDLSELRVVSKTVVITDNSADGIWTAGFAVVNCPRRYRVISGGASVEGPDNGRTALKESRRSLRGWIAEATQDTGLTGSLRVEAICLKRQAARPRNR